MVKRKIKMQKIRSLYLAHPWNMREFVRNWELKIEKLYELNLDNPFYDHYTKEIEDVENNWIKNKRNKRISKMIVEKDLRAIERNDGLIAFIEYSKHSLGTPMEIFYSGRILQKPTFVISSNCGGHPWIKDLATKVFKDINKFEDFIKFL